MVTKTNKLHQSKNAIESALMNNLMWYKKFHTIISDWISLSDQTFLRSTIPSNIFFLNLAITKTKRSYDSL
jgi:hypothetical protein